MEGASKSIGGVARDIGGSARGASLSAQANLDVSSTTGSFRRGGRVVARLFWGKLSRLMPGPRTTACGAEPSIATRIEGASLHPSPQFQASALLRAGHPLKEQTMNIY